MRLWLLIAVVCAAASAVGYELFSTLPKGWLSVTQSFAGGVILVMLTNSMILESNDYGHKLAGIFTGIGFLPP